MRKLLTIFLGLGIINSVSANSNSFIPKEGIICRTQSAPVGPRFIDYVVLERYGRREIMLSELNDNRNARGDRLGYYKQKYKVSFEVTKAKTYNSQERSEWTGNWTNPPKHDYFVAKLSDLSGSYFENSYAFVKLVSYPAPTRGELDPKNISIILDPVFGKGQKGFFSKCKKIDRAVRKALKY